MFNRYTTFKEVEELYKERAEELREQSEGLDKESCELLYELDDDYNLYKKYYINGCKFIALLNNIGEKMRENNPGTCLAIVDALEDYNGHENNYVYFEEEGIYHGELSYEASLNIEGLYCDYLDKLEGLSDRQKIEDFIYYNVNYWDADEEYVYDYNRYYIQKQIKKLAEEVVDYEELNRLINRCEEFKASAEAIEHRVRETIRYEHEKIDETLDELYNKEAEDDRQ